jgi:TetR/AcrR family transcriptional repressor of nem operon
MHDVSPSIVPPRKRRRGGTSSNSRRARTARSLSPDATRSPASLAICARPRRSLASALADRSESAREALAACFAEWEAYLIDGFTVMHEDGLIPGEADPAELAITVMTALQGGLLLAQTNRDVRPLELALEMAIAHVERYRAG